MCLSPAAQIHDALHVNPCLCYSTSTFQPLGSVLWSSTQLAASAPRGWHGETPQWLQETNFKMTSLKPCNDASESGLVRSPAQTEGGHRHNRHIRILYMVSAPHTSLLIAPHTWIESWPCSKTAALLCHVEAKFGGEMYQLRLMAPYFSIS